MKHVFHGPAHRVQLSIHQGGPLSSGTRIFRVEALPRSAHKACAYARGECLYVGPSATAAWEAVLQFVPTAQARASLRPDLEYDAALPLCPFCGTAVRSHHRQTEVRHPTGQPDAPLRRAHMACAGGEITVDPNLLSR